MPKAFSYSYYFHEKHLLQIYFICKGISKYMIYDNALDSCRTIISDKNPCINQHVLINIYPKYTNILYISFTPI